MRSFKDINTLTEEEESEIVEQLVENRMDSYLDFAEMLYAIAVNCDYCLKYVPECLDDYVSVANTAALREMLKTCAEMMLDCDPTYRDPLYRDVKSSQ